LAIYSEAVERSSAFPVAPLSGTRAAKHATIEAA
jgi:hypothetical protein